MFASWRGTCVSFGVFPQRLVEGEQLRKADYYSTTYLVVPQKKDAQLGAPAELRRDGVPTLPAVARVRRLAAVHLVAEVVVAQVERLQGPLARVS